MSGIRQSRSAASSRPIVFLPSSRYGSLSVERSNQPSSGATFAATLPAVAIEPSSVKTWAPAICASAIAAGGVPRGTMTATGSPARAPYAAAAPPALPADGMTKPRAPSVRARVIAMERPRALKEPVGFWPSSLAQSLRIPRWAANRGSASRGVPPSPSVTGTSPASSGVSSRKRYIPGGRCRSASLLTLAEIRERTPRPAGHIRCVIFLTEAFVRRLDGRALVSSQNALRLNRWSEPEPDLVLLRPPLARYGKDVPTPAHALLVVEVADSSHHRDRAIKLPRYAAAGVP